MDQRGGDRGGKSREVSKDKMTWYQSITSDSISVLPLASN